MKKSIFSNIFGSIFLFIGLLLFLFGGSYSNILIGFSFILISLVIYPIFNYLCKIVNKRFSAGRRVFLGFGTFFILLPFLSENLSVAGVIIFYLVLVSIFWVIMFSSNKYQFSDMENGILEEESEKNDIFHKYYNSVIRDRNNKVIAVMEYENENKNTFCDLDIMTVHAIAKMISESREKHNSALNRDMPEINISKLVLSFCKDSQKLEDEYELNDLYTKEYYARKINDCCSEMSNYIKNKIKENLAPQNNNRYIDIYNSCLDLFTEAMPSISGLKFYKTISKYGDDSAVEGLFKNVNYSFNGALRYLTDVLATCTCISKMIFVERKIKQLDNNNEFYQIISNMAKELKDTDVIIEKSKNVYNEFYKSSLGFINDELLYGMAIAIMVNRINNKKLSKKDEEILSLNTGKAEDVLSLDKIMKEWIKIVAEKHRNLEMNILLLNKIVDTIDIKNFDLLLNSLGRFNEYSELYYLEVEKNNKISDKNRYLKGDFEKEKKELSGKYSLNNITTGTQFELYLVNLFNDLGYKSKHNGKAGDQGADLILKKGDYVYAVQAKYYTGKLDNTSVQEIIGALKFYNANQGVVVTNSEFTQGAKELAKANNVILIDGKGLKKLTDFVFNENKEEDILKKFEK